TRLEIETRDRVVFDFATRGPQRLPTGVQTTRRRAERREVKRPQREVHEVTAKIDDAAAARESHVAEPWLVGAVRVVEDDVHRIDLPELPLPHEIANRLHPCGEAVGEVDAEQAVGTTCGIHYAASLRRGPTERLLAEDGKPPFERCDRLLRVHRTW